MAVAVGQPETESWWRAVVTRDARFDGTFVYAVRSTGIYCRPSCPSRRPRRERVTFFPRAEEAERAGFRPCRRCRPGDVPSAVALVEAVRRHVEEHLRERITLAALSAAVGVSAGHLQRTFRRATGITPRQYVEERRLGVVRKHLRERGGIAAAVYAAGYGSGSRLYERAPSCLGMTPGRYGRGGQGADVAYAIADSPLGRLLVAATEKGVCLIAMGSSDAELEAVLAQELPAATRAADGRLEGWVTAVLRLLDGQPQRADIPLDVRATAFQRRVWAALQAIPRGETRAYAEVAAAVGSPGSARAVGRACAANPVALVVPCHRVLRRDGGLGGYRWGVQRKDALLRSERGGG